MAISLQACVLAFASALGQPAVADDWKFDVVHLKTGGTLQGLVAKETTGAIVFWRVTRKPGVSTGVIVATIECREIAHIDGLDEKERALLRSRLQALDPTGRGEVRRMASLSLSAGDWGKNGKGQARVYRAEHFVLESNGAEDVVRRAAVRLENVYAAYTRFLPPRVEAAEPTRVSLARSRADYQALLRDEGHAALVNPAFYDTGRNRICCGSELQRLGDELERIRKEHHRSLAELNDKETELHKLYKGKTPPQLLAPIRESRFRIAQQDDRNERLFQEATTRLFQRLYHEAFHAYLANFVYPPSETDVPRWLNEGLAQVFETAVIEGGELRVGHPDRERVHRVQELARKGQLVPLADLLKSGPKQFLVQHATEQQNSDRYYLSSWALAHYLTFERRLLGGKAMDQYVRALHRGGDPLAAFREFAGQPLPEFEKELRHWIERLSAGK